MGKALSSVSDLAPTRFELLFKIGAGLASSQREPSLRLNEARDLAFGGEEYARLHQGIGHIANCVLVENESGIRWR